MNPCHFCGQPATIHYTSIIGGKQSEQHLCEACGREQGVVSDAAGGGALNVHAIVQFFEGGTAPAADPHTLKCPECGLKYAQFRADGRLGCPHDYDAFGGSLGPLVERIHRATGHVGKVPRAQARRDHLSDLHDRLGEAVAAERYEEAARLRDLIRRKEGADEPR